MLTREYVEAKAQEFWKYASELAGVHTLEDIYLDWVEQQDMTIDEFGYVFAQISIDVDQAFGIKTALRRNTIPMIEVLQEYSNNIFDFMKKQKEVLGEPEQEEEVPTNLPSLGQEKEPAIPLETAPMRETKIPPTKMEEFARTTMPQEELPIKEEQSTPMAKEQPAPMPEKPKDKATLSSSLREMVNL